MATGEIKTKSLITFATFDFSVEFDSGAPNSYVGVKDVDISKSGYTPIVISISTLLGTSSIEIMSLQFDINNKARMAYARSSIGVSRELTEWIHVCVVYVKTA